MRWDRSCWDRPQSPSVGCKLGTICPFHSSCLLYSSSWGLMAFPQASIRWLSSIHTSLKCPGLLESTDHSSLEIPPFMPYLPYVIRWECRRPMSRNLTVIHVIPSWSHRITNDLHTRNLPILIRVHLLRASFLFSCCWLIMFSFAVTANAWPVSGHCSELVRWCLSSQQRRVWWRLQFSDAKSSGYIFGACCDLICLRWWRMMHFQTPCPVS